jgi:hypothetical protein
MRVVVVSKKEPSWSFEGYLFKETETKWCLWANVLHTIEVQFPKHLFVMNKIDMSDV